MIAHDYDTGTIDDPEVTEVEEGFLVIGANLESEARLAVLEDLIDRLGADPHALGTAVLELDAADARPGYWEVAEVHTFAVPSVYSRHAQVIPRAVEGCFGWLLRVED